MSKISCKLLSIGGYVGRSRPLILIGVASVSFLLDPLVIPSRSRAIAQTLAELCPSPALSRIKTHRVAAGETIDSIAAANNLLPITVLAMNPAVQGSTLTPGTTLRIPPFNGTEVNVAAGQTWQDIAASYRVRADVLFEINGCPDSIPNRIFVPGVSWLLDAVTTPGETAKPPDTDPLSSYPLSDRGQVIANYGWQTDPSRDELVFSSGITLEAGVGTSVLAAGAGTVAYVGEEPSLGTLIVINHDQGFQTRYAQVLEPSVKSGDRVRPGQVVAMTTPNLEDEETAFLYFEVRTNSSLGWIARDPGNYIPELAVR